jgi:hypothetical protein
MAKAKAMTAKNVIGKCGHWTRASLRELCAIVKHHRARSILIASTLLSLIIFIVLVLGRLRESPQTLMMVTAETEILSVMVDSSADMKIPVVNGRIGTVNGWLDKPPMDCKSGFFVPSQQAHITLRRVQNGPLSIVIEPNKSGISGEFAGENNTTSTYRENVLIIFDASASSPCPAESEVRIPIGGSAAMILDPNLLSENRDRLCCRRN